MHHFHAVLLSDTSAAVRRALTLTSSPKFLPVCVPQHLTKACAHHMQLCLVLCNHTQKTQFCFALLRKGQYLSCNRARYRVSSQLLHRHLHDSQLCYRLLHDASSCLFPKFIKEADVACTLRKMDNSESITKHSACC